MEQLAGRLAAARRTRPQCHTPTQTADRAARFVWRSATGHSFGVDMIRIATRMQYGVLMVYVFALVMGVWSAVLGVQLAIDSSVPGGLAVILAGAILIALSGMAHHFQVEADSAGAGSST
jgi:hypothetical protein